MRRAAAVGLLLVIFLAACNDDVVFVGGTPAAPVALDAAYYAGAVTVSWELGSDWNGEAFRVYSRRATDADYFLIAEVTSCAGGICSYEDWNVVAGETYEYYVTAIDPDSGSETSTVDTVLVAVPDPTPPPVPGAPLVIALDAANYFTWDANARTESDFSHYKVYLDDAGSSFLLGETDSEGFLDLLAPNGVTLSYFVTSVDTGGHESTGSQAAPGTPRPDFHGEWVYDRFSSQSDFAGFRFEEDEATNPIAPWNAPDRHFWLETDLSGSWLVAGPGTTIHQTGFATTALKCGVGADAGCTDVSVAPVAGYGSQDVELFTQTTYVLQVLGDDAQLHYGVIRVELLGLDQNGDSIMIFDWAYQLQADNPNLVSSSGG